MDLTFWGVRGSVATSGSHVARIGGNTACLELTSGGHRLILDGGTGLRNLGDALLRAGQPVEATLLFSHLHWDHVQGFPFFGPAYHPKSALTLYGPGVDGDRVLREVLARQMEPPHFPVPLSAMKAALDFKAVASGHVFEVGPFRVSAFEVPHPQGCMGYRVDADGKSFVYMTDVELTPATVTAEVRALIAGADLLVLDAQFTREEYEGVGTMPRKGWGHSTNLDAAQIARENDVQRLVLFHHDPAHDDVAVEAMVEGAKQIFEVSEPAREGKQIHLAR
jgi:phosphoribosyl 1,2-cyclic phosphodiesterase